MRTADQPTQPGPSRLAQAPQLRRTRPGYLSIGLFALVVLVAGCSVEDEEATTNRGDAEAGQTEIADQALFPGRPDVKENDKERNIGEPAELSGYTVTVNASQFQHEVSEFQTEGYVVAEVTILNRDEEAQPYNVFLWKLITPRDTIIDPTFTGAHQELSGGNLVQGGTVTGQVIWEVDTEKGDFYIIYDPSGLGDNCAIWKVTV